MITRRRPRARSLLAAALLLLGLLALPAPAAAQQIITSSGPCPSALVFALNPGAHCWRTDTSAEFIWNGSAWLPVATLTTAGAQTTDNQLFLNAVDVCYSDNALLVKSRLATGNWALARTAAGAETYNIECAFGWPTRTSSGKGVQVTGISIVYAISVVPLTSHTFQGMQTAAYANNVATAVANYGGGASCAIATATQANPYATPCTIPTPAFMNAAAAQITVDWQAVLANTGVYQVMGILVSFAEIPL